jgi:hypothetical protein
MRSSLFGLVVVVTAAACGPSKSTSTRAAKPWVPDGAGDPIGGGIVPPVIPPGPAAGGATGGGPTAGGPTSSWSAQLEGTPPRELTPQALSDDGRLVVFASVSSPSPGHPSSQIVLWDRADDTTMVVSVGRDGAAPDAAVRRPWISADGKVIAFESRATNLTTDAVPAAPVPSSVFAYDRTTRRLELASRGADGQRAGARIAGVSADGRFVLLRSNDHLTMNDLPSWLSGVYLLDRSTGSVALVSTDADGHAVPAECAVMSSNARFIVFNTWEVAAAASGDPSAAETLLVRDVAGTVTPVSGAAGNASSMSHLCARSVSDDGATIVYSTLDAVASRTIQSEIRVVDVALGTTRVPQLPSAEITTVGQVSAARDGRVMVFWFGTGGRFDGGTSTAFAYYPAKDATTVPYSPASVGQMTSMALSGDGSQMVVIATPWPGPGAASLAAGPLVTRDGP